MVVPVYFDPSLEKEKVRHILRATLSDQNLFLESSRVVFVVDRGTTAEHVLEELNADLQLGSRTVRLKRNQGKMGAVREGLRRLLQEPVRYLVTRDCDGDHVLQDLGRIVQMAEEIREAVPGRPISVFGTRPSLERPMEWVRKEWEMLTNGVLEGLTEFLLAREGRVLDRRYWNGYPLDLQSGYRLYDRKAAELAVRSLDRLPDDRDTYLMACEMVPFVDVSLEGGVIGQVQRMTCVEQPVSSFRTIDFGTSYGKLLRFLSDLHGIDPVLLLRIFDNYMLGSEIFFSSVREQVLKCRDLIGGRDVPIHHPSIM